MRAAFVLLCLLPFGCSSDRDMVEKRLSSLRDDITRLQTENDRLSERVGVLESKPPMSAPAARDATPRVDRPALKVVKLVPGESGDGAMAVAEPSPEERPDAPGSRPVIRVRGKESRDEVGKFSSKEAP